MVERPPFIVYFLTMTSTALDYVCIFTGGSIRGAAYVGALRAMEELGVNNKCFVGSSVGSVIGTFYAAGCSPDELEDIVNDINFELFKDINFTLTKDFSISKGEHFLEWIREIIERKYYGTSYEKGQNKPVTFADFPKDIVILTTDINTTEVKVFSKKTTPDFEVAMAVRISSSMPGLLKPLSYQGHILVDGDLSRSWPIWKIVPSLLEYDSRILEFRLEGGKNRYKLDNTADFLNSVYTAFSNFAADHIISTYKSRDKFDYIRLDSEEVNITDFNISNDRKKELYNSGYKTTMEFFTKELPQKRASILPHYREILNSINSIKTNIEQSKYIIAKNNLAELFVFISKVRKQIDLAFYDEILNFYDLFKSGLKTTFGMITVLKDKEKIITEIENISSRLESKVKEIEMFINNG